MALGLRHRRHDGRRLNGTGSAGVPLAGDDFWFVAAIIRRRAHGIHPRHRAGQRVDCIGIPSEYSGGQNGCPVVVRGGGMDHAARF